MVDLISKTTLGKQVSHCQTCGRKTALTFHHLIPRKLHRRKRFYKNYTKEHLNKGIYICRSCHKGLHRTYDEMTLGKEFQTLQAILADASLKRHFTWVAKQKVKS